MQEGSYYLITYSWFHSGDITDWTDTAKSLKEAREKVEKAMRLRDKDTWSGKAENEIIVKIQKVKVGKIIK